MNIVILGAGDIGLHLAITLSKLGYGVVLVDKNRAILEEGTRDLDISTKVASGTDWKLLEELLEIEPALIVALTDHDEVNLVACNIAKHLGYPRTIARVRDQTFLSSSRLNFERLFAVDHLICPEKLTASTMASMILTPGSLAKEQFAHGSVEMETFKIPKTWDKTSIQLREKRLLNMPEGVMVGLIKRKDKLIFPHGEDVLLPDDEVSFVGEKDAILALYDFLGISRKIPQSAVIVGGSLVGIHLAKELTENNIHVEILEKNREKAHFLAEALPKSTVVRHDGLDYKFLESERMGEAGVFVASTRSDEINFLSASAAINLGCKSVMVSLTETSYIPLFESHGIHYIASPRLSSTNRILSIVREKTISSMVSLYDNQAEIIEVKVSFDSKIAGIPIKQLGPKLPSDFLIAYIQSRGKVFIAQGDAVLSPGDTALIITHPKHVHEIRKLF